MRVWNVVQGSPEWLMLRAGLPTASEFSRILTPKGRVSKSSRDYKAWLLAERVLRHPLTVKQTAAMIRGTEFEAEAVEFYEGVTEAKTERIGFVTTDSGLIGASPDRWAGADGQVEIKVPEPHTHMAYFLAQLSLEACEAEIVEQINSKGNRSPDYLAALQKRYDEAKAQTLAEEYLLQTTGQLWVTERKWADLLSYSPEGLPPVYVHLNRDEQFISVLGQAVSEFSRDLEEEAARLVASGVIQKE
jgi:YqaJ-like viral recombinase domain